MGLFLFPYNDLTLVKTEPYVHPDIFLPRGYDGFKVELWGRRESGKTCQKGKTTREILKERHAKGEITTELFKKRTEDLKK